MSKELEIHLEIQHIRRWIIVRKKSAIKEHQKLYIKQLEFGSKETHVLNCEKTRHITDVWKLR